MMIQLSKIWPASATKTVVLHARHQFWKQLFRSNFTSIKFDISQTWNEELLSLSTTTNKGFLVYGYKSPGCKLQQIIHVKVLLSIGTRNQCFKEMFYYLSLHSVASTYQWTSFKCPNFLVRTTSSPSFLKFVTTPPRS